LAGRGDKLLLELDYLSGRGVLWASALESGRIKGLRSMEPRCHGGAGVRRFSGKLLHEWDAENDNSEQSQHTLHRNSGKKYTIF
jgi:hypothetical protein